MLYKKFSFLTLSVPHAAVKMGSQQKFERKFNAT